VGVTQKPLTIVVSQAMSSWPEVQALAAQKHVIYVMTPDLQLDWTKVDVILGEKARLMNSKLKKYLGIALDEARKERYGKVG
jgi:hypothetical protein